MNIDEFIIAAAHSRKSLPNIREAARPLLMILDGPAASSGASDHTNMTLEDIGVALQRRPQTRLVRSITQRLLTRVEDQLFGSDDEDQADQTLSLKEEACEILNLNVHVPTASSPEFALAARAS